MDEQLRRLLEQLAEQGSIPLSSAPSAQWARLTRQYLAQCKKALLEQATESAEQVGETGVSQLLRAFRDSDVATVDSLDPILHRTLRQSGREEEAWTVRLVHMHLRAQLAEAFEDFPVDQQMAVLEVALQACEQAIAIARALGDEACVAVYLGVLGTGCAKIRRLPEAERAYTEALAIRRRLAQAQPQVYEPYVATTLNNRGNVLSNLRRWEAAEEAYNEALAIYRRLAQAQPDVYEPDVAMTLNNLGAVLSDLRRWEAAEEAYNEALAIYRRLAQTQPDVYEPDVAMTLNNLGALLSDLRRLREALDAYTEALDIYRRLAQAQPQVYEPDVAMTLNNLGALLSDLRRWEAAEEAYTTALEIARQHDIPDRRATIASNLGWLWMRQERWEGAAVVLKEGVEQVERLRAEVLSLDQRERILRENIHIYEHLLICLMKLQRHEEALQVAEQGKSRTLIDLLTMRDLRPRNAPPEVIAEYEQMLFRARALEDSLRRTDGNGTLEERERGRTEEELRQIQEERIQVHQRLTELESIIRQHDPDFLPHAKPLTTDGILDLSQQADAVLVLFRVTEVGTFIFLVFPDRTYEVVTVANFTTDTLDQMLLRTEGEQLVGGWVWHYYNARARWFEVLDETLGLLYQRLLKPVHECLQRNASKMANARGGVVFVPNRGLAILPLHACWWENGTGEWKYLIDEYVVRYAPSLSVFKRCLERERAGRAHETLLAVANPTGDLVFSEWECTKVEQLIDDPQCLILWREQATKDEVLHWTSNRHYLHFSCHGQYRLDAPLASSLRLANGGELTLGEIFEEVYLTNSWLVVLSACETGLVDFREVADEHYGLATGFLYAGAPTVYSSLWSVADFSTALLMVKTYEGLVKEKKSKSEALRDAQLWLRDLTAGAASALAQVWEAELRERMPWVDIAPWRRRLQIDDPNARPFAHPYYWSAFQCVGV